MRAGIVFHGLLSEAEKLAGEIADCYSGAADWWLSAAEDVPGHGADMDVAEMLETIGGDVTMLIAVK